MSRPLKVQIVERARELIADEQHWCQRHLALDANGVVVSPISAKAVKRCALGAVIAAAYQLTNDYNAAHQLGHEVLGTHYRAATLMHVNDSRGHAAVLALFDDALSTCVVHSLPIQRGPAAYANQLWAAPGIRNLVMNTFDRVRISVSGDEHHRHFAHLSQPPRSFYPFSSAF
jgi:hypothetical protein